MANTAKRNGLFYRLCKTKPLLTIKAKHDRLLFAQVGRPLGFWPRVVWTDEASFALYSATKGQWVEAGSAPAPHETVKWLPK